jgi:hypothetical protein
MNAKKVTLFSAIVNQNELHKFDKHLILSTGHVAAAARRNSGIGRPQVAGCESYFAARNP